MALTDENSGGFVATMPMAPAYGGGYAKNRKLTPKGRAGKIWLSFFTKFSKNCKKVVDNLLAVWYIIVTGNKKPENKGGNENERN